MNNNFTEGYLRPYINEICTNAKWTLSLIDQGDKSEDFDKIKYYSLAVSTASVIAQLAYITISKFSPEKERSKERIKLLDAEFPDKPTMPKGMREIRNSMQHFDERMDTWLFSLIENGTNGYAYIVDNDKNIEVYSGSPNSQFDRRMINEDELKYWDHTINIKELKNWCNEILTHYANI